MSQLVTEGIEVRVQPQHWPERSNPRERRWAFAYTITIANRGSTAAQLLSRRWVITDGNGKVETVEGEGVVGQKPRLAAGERFEYTSWVMLETPHGTMKGAYVLVRPDGSRFEAAIPEFLLALPHARN